MHEIGGRVEMMRSESGRMRIDELVFHLTFEVISHGNKAPTDLVINFDKLFREKTEATGHIALEAARTFGLVVENL